MSSTSFHSEESRRTSRETLETLWSQGMSSVITESRYPDPRYTVDDLRKSLLPTFGETLADMLESHNKRCAASRLTSDILASVFCLAPTHNRAAIGLVCRRWHDILHQNPRIWSVIEFDGRYGPPDTLKQILALSVQAPLHLDIRMTAFHYEDSCQALEANMYRCITLHVKLNRDLPDDAQQHVTRALSVAAPRLEELRFEDQHGILGANEFKYKALLGGNAPCLQLVKMQCDLDGILWSTESPEFPSVKKALFNSSTGVIGARHFQGVLRLFPNVVELACEFSTWLESGVRSPLLLPRTLQSLVIMPDSAFADVNAILNSIETRGTQEVAVSFNADAISDQSGDILSTLYNIPMRSGQTPAYRAFIARTVSFEASSFSNKSLNVFMLEEEVDISDEAPGGAPVSLVECQRPGGVMRWVMDIGHRAILDPACFVNVRRLELTEMGFDPAIVGKALPAMPELIHLTIFLLRFKSHARFKNISGFVAPALSRNRSAGHSGDQDDDTRFLACPKLRVLRIGAPVLDPSSQPVARLEPCMVTAFVKSHLRFDAAKLEVLQFNGIEMYVSDPLDFEAMLQLARETVWNEKHLAWAIKTCQLIEWS